MNIRKNIKFIYPGNAKLILKNNTVIIPKNYDYNYVDIGHYKFPCYRYEDMNIAHHKLLNAYNNMDNYHMLLHNCKPDEKRIIINGINTIIHSGYPNYFKYYTNNFNTYKVIHWKHYNSHIFNYIESKDHKNVDNDFIDVESLFHGDYINLIPKFIVDKYNKITNI